MAEKEYIERKPLIDFITKGLNNPDKEKAFGYDAIEILAEIQYAPTADVVPRAEVEWLLDDFQRSIRADAKVGMSAGEILLHINNMLAELKKKYIGDKR